MSQIVRKFLSNDAVDGTKLKLQNNQMLKARNAADSADIDIVKVNASDRIEFPSAPQTASAPATGNDLVNKTYADGLIAASSQVQKEAAQLVATSNLALTAEQTIDGVLTSASRILLVGQTAPEENGLYVTAAGAWARASDMNSSAEVFRGMKVYIAAGDSHAHSEYVLNSAGPYTLGTTGLSFYKVDQVNKESLTLNGTDITNQYKDFAFKAKPSSVDLVVNGVSQIEGVDYSMSESGGVSRLTFLNDLATGGGAALISGDILRVKYIIKR